MNIFLSHLLLSYLFSTIITYLLWIYDYFGYFGNQNAVIDGTVFVVAIIGTSLSALVVSKYNKIDINSVKVIFTLSIIFGICFLFGVASFNPQDLMLNLAIFIGYLLGSILLIRKAIVV